MSNDEVLTELAGDVKSILREIVTLKDIAQENRRALRGSDSSSGLIATVDALTEDVQNLEESMSRVLSALSGDTKEPGLLERVRLLESFQRTIRTWGSAIVVAIIVDVVARVWPKIIQFLASL